MWMLPTYSYVRLVLLVCEIDPCVDVNEYSYVRLIHVWMLPTKLMREIDSCVDVNEILKCEIDPLWMLINTQV